MRSVFALDTVSIMEGRKYAYNTMKSYVVDMTATHSPCILKAS